MPSRGALTPTDTRSGPRKVADPFSVLVHTGTELPIDANRDIRLPAGTPQTLKLEKNARVRLPEGQDRLPPPEISNEGWLYHFPANCQIRMDSVKRMDLGLVISIAVMGICLWGTLMGCLIPLGLQRLGMDPAVASGALVATLVDVTGILIYFSSASLILL